MTSRMVVVLGLWLIFGVALVRAIQKGGLRHRAGRRTWLMFFLSILACTFWGETAERALDHRFYDLPVALYLKYICLIGVCHLYRQLLQEVGGVSSKPTRLDYLAPAAIALGLLSFVGYALLLPISQHDLRFLVIGARDAVILLFILTSFYRDTLAMWRRERVLAMRLKQSFIVLFFTFYAITTVGSISAAGLTLLHGGDPDWAARFLQPFLYPAILFFVLMLIPYRWYAGLPDYLSFRLYYRLKQLERRVFALAGTHPDQAPLPWITLRAEQLELATYRTVIAILDGYPMIPLTADTDNLIQAIKESVMNNPEYDDLIQALGRCADV